MDVHDTEHTTREAAQRLRETSLFKCAADEGAAFHALASLCKTEVFEESRVIVREGEMGDRMYIIKSGEVEVRKRTLHGESFTVSRLSAQDNGFFGEVALIDRDKRTATVTAVTRCEMYVIDRDRFLELGERYPRLALVVTREISVMLCRRLRKADDDIITLFSALVQEVAESGGVAEADGDIE
ncbi:MAG: cyclic nucleotide-binding domain-containing protein [Chitinivibrionales bacterium]|nr:cyclic nucleotide-binding domain-containing protein [Chitinivibrionales bacterium]